MVRTSFFVLILALSSTSPLVADTAAEPIWRWVDEAGRVTFSNIEPPALARDVTVIESRWASDKNRPQAAARPDHQPWRDAYESLLDALDDLRGSLDDLRSDRSKPRYILYTPEFDYAYSRRYHRGHRPGGFDRRGRYKRLSPPFGTRRYDRRFHSDAYRYRSDLPSFGTVQTTRAPASRAANRDPRAYARSQTQPGRTSVDARRP